MKRNHSPLLHSVLIGLLAILLPALAFSWTGKVVGVSDGDTITVMHDGKGEKIRLYGVDTPEKSRLRPESQAVHIRYGVRQNG